MRCASTTIFLAVLVSVEVVRVASQSSLETEDLLGLESADAVVSIPGLDVAPGLPILPLAPQHFRPKRKPQRFRFTGERPRFRPRGRLTLEDENRNLEARNEVEAEEVVQTTFAPETPQPTQRTSFLPQIRRKLPSFPKRSRPSFLEVTTEPPTEAPTTTTTELPTVTDRAQTRFDELEFLETVAPLQPIQPERQVEPVQQLQKIDLLSELVQERQPEILSPLESNSVVEGRDANLLDEVRARTVAITGAQPVGVTRNVSARSKSARLIKAARRGGDGLQLAQQQALQGQQQQPQQNRRFRVKGGARDRKQEVLEQLDQLVLVDNTPQQIQADTRGAPIPDRRVAAESDRRVVAPPLPPSGGRRVPGRRKSGQHKVGTVERYRFENDDGSITWGYENEDGSYKEETIGVDCITRGKYGYIDPTGEVREYSYSSGVKCDPLTRKVNSSDQSPGGRGINRLGVFDYNQNKFIMPDGRKVRVVVNQGNKARGRRH